MPILEVNAAGGSVAVSPRTVRTMGENFIWVCTDGSISSFTLNSKPASPGPWPFQGPSVPITSANATGPKGGSYIASNRYVINPAGGVARSDWQYSVTATTSPAAGGRTITLDPHIIVDGSLGLGQMPENIEELATRLETLVREAVAEGIAEFGGHEPHVDVRVNQDPRQIVIAFS